MYIYTGTAPPLCGSALCGSARARPAHCSGLRLLGGTRRSNRNRDRLRRSLSSLTSCRCIAASLLSIQFPLDHRGMLTKVVMSWCSPGRSYLRRPGKLELLPGIVSPATLLRGIEGDPAPSLSSQPLSMSSGPLMQQPS